MVGPLGIAAGYGAPTSAIEAAFERGCNYFYWGSRRTHHMARAIRNIKARGDRDKIVLVLQTYSRSALLMETFFHNGLKKAGLEQAEVLLLGWHNKTPSRGILERAQKLKEKGLIKAIALSGHNRHLFPELAAEGLIDICHVRYNAVHRGAESETFAHLDPEKSPGVVIYTATRWGDLLNPKKMPPGQGPPSAAEVYRFCLTNPAVDLVITGPRNEEQMTRALATLDQGPLDQDELLKMVELGDWIYRHHKKMSAKEQ